MRARELALALVVLAAPAYAHQGPPYPILVDEPVGEHLLSVWADPDVGTGTFYMYIDEPDGDARLPLVVGVQPTDERLPEAFVDARAADPKQPYQMIAKVEFDRRGPWNVRFMVEGVREFDLVVDVTPPGLGTIDLLWFLFPFLAIGILWIKVVMKKRSLSRAAVVTSAALVCVSLLAEPGAAQDGAPAAQEGAAPKPPRYSFLRANEDWSAFVGGDRLDSMHRISLNKSGKTWIGFGGRAEMRLEGWHNFNFGAAPSGVPNDDEFLLARLLLHADLHMGDHFRLFVEGKSAHVNSRELAGGERTLDQDILDLQELFVDVDVPTGKDGNLRLRPGRQMLLFGAQRLISPLPWGNTLRTWDGVTAQWKDAGWTVEALGAAFVPVDKTAFNEPDEDQLLYGVYATTKRASGKLTDLYALGTTRGDVTVNGTTGDSDRWTLGVRHQAIPAKRVDLEVEGAYQLGGVGSGDVSAGFATLELGWRPSGLPWNARLFTILDYASGDREAGGNVETFDQLYPLGHAYLGYADVIGRQNIKAAAIGATCNPREELTLRLAGHGFWLAELSDAIYNAGGGVLRAPGSFESSQIAYEIDVSGVRTFGRHFLASAGYSHVFAGKAIEDSGPSDDIDFAYLRLIFTF